MDLQPGLSSAWTTSWSKLSAGARDQASRKPRHSRSNRAPRRSRSERRGRSRPSFARIRRGPTGARATGLPAGPTRRRNVSERHAELDREVARPNFDRELLDWIDEPPLVAHAEKETRRPHREGDAGAEQGAWLGCALCSSCPDGRAVPFGSYRSSFRAGRAPQGRRSGWWQRPQISVPTEPRDLDCLHAGVRLYGKSRSGAEGSEPWVALPRLKRGAG